MTPDRSAHRPPRPARPIGTAALSAAVYWPDSVRLVAPVITRSRDSRIRLPETISRTLG